MNRTELQKYLDEQLRVRVFRDYCPNGLQVQGKDEIESILCATTANLALCVEAADNGYDAILCHHGFFWKNEPADLTGIRRQRIKILLQADISLFAYHLPLDVHPRWGNNVALAERMGWNIEGFADAGGVENLLCYGSPTQTLNSTELVDSLRESLDRIPIAVGREDSRSEPLRRIAWCTGAAQGFLEQAVALGADAYVSGEISLAQTDFSREAGILYVSAGHHATERYGVQRLANHLREKFQLRVNYSEQNNPV